MLSRGVVPGLVVMQVTYVLAGRMDEVGAGVRAGDVDRAPAEPRVKAPGLDVLQVDAEIT